MNIITNFDLKQWEQEESKLDALERENRELSQSRNDERKAAMNLREDLVKERMKSDQIQETMEGLHKQLKQLGLDPKKLDADAAMLSNQRIQNLEGKLVKYTYIPTAAYKFTSEKKIWLGHFIK